MAKWYFALSEASLGHADHEWESLICAALRSARANTSLEPHFVYDGAESAFTQELRRQGVVIHHHRVSFYDAMVAGRIQAFGHADPLFLAIAAGAYLRTEIPALEMQDEYVLYTDCDTMFLRDPDMAQFRPATFACAPQRVQTDYDDFNSGVMVMNLPALRRDLPAFTQSIIANFNRYTAYDQDAYREFYAGRYSHLPPSYNWKPYWGPNPDATIVHFHGPKPAAVRKLMMDPAYAPPQIWRELFEENPAGYAAYLPQWERFAAPVPG